jgi:hypothetical protein
MTNFADGITVGSAPPYGPGPSFSQPNTQFGLPMSPGTVYAIAPATSIANNLVLSASNVTTGGTFTLQATSGITTTTVAGLTVYQLDVPRVITYSNVGTAGTVSGAVIIRGFDYYNQPMSQTLVIGASNVGATTKAFYTVSSITVASSVASPVVFGTGDVMGLPYKVANAGDALFVWNGTLQTSSAGFTAAVTTTATSTTGDTRGTYSLPTVSANGVYRFNAFIFQRDLTSGAYGVTQA